MTERARAHVFVSGTVQGVASRATTRDTAREHGVDGWVRNLDDGRVEAVFEGARGGCRDARGVLSRGQCHRTCRERRRDTRKATGRERLSRAVVTATETDGTESEDGGSSDGLGPGFGVGGAVAALGGAGYLLRRRLVAGRNED